MKPYTELRTLTRIWLVCELCSAFVLEPEVHDQVTCNLPVDGGCGS